MRNLPYPSRVTVGDHGSDTSCNRLFAQATVRNVHMILMVKVLLDSAEILKSDARTFGHVAAFALASTPTSPVTLSHVPFPPALKVVAPVSFLDVAIHVISVCLSDILAESIARKNYSQPIILAITEMMQKYTAYLESSLYHCNENLFITYLEFSSNQKRWPNSLIG